MCRRAPSDQTTAAVAIGAAAAMIVISVSRWVETEPAARPISYMVAGLSITAGVAAGFLTQPGGIRAVGAAIAAAYLVCWKGTTDSPAMGNWLVLADAVVYGFVVRTILAIPNERTPGEADPANISQAPAEDATSTESLWVVLPTYCERDNVRWLLPEIRRLVPAAHVLVVDDESPDGTADAVRELAHDDPGIRLIVRCGPRGLDSALLAGFRDALAAGAGIVVTMDADGSHDPRGIFRLLAALREADVVIGSRYVKGGRVEGWPVWRRLVSLVANAYARQVLGLAMRDCSSGFRAYRCTALQAVLPYAPSQAGYAILEALLFLARRKGLSVVEVPIWFRRRRQGHSKLHWTEAWRGARVLKRLAGRTPTTGLRILRGFSLVELLTVIAIFAIVMGIVLPVLTSARRAAQKTTCQSNVRQLGIALALYTQDHDDVWPRWYHGSLGTTWDLAVYPYVKNAQVYHCPSNPKSLPQAVVRSYALPRNVSGLPLAAIPRPTDTVALYEKGGEALGARIDATGEYFGQTYWTTNFLRWHNDGKVFAFVDGHARFWPVGQGPWAYDFRPPLGNNTYGPGYCGGQFNTIEDADGGPGKNLPP